MNEARVCRLKALVRETWPERFTAKANLALVGKPEPRPTPAETFHDASQCIADFAVRWRSGKASQSELEDADTLLLGLRRLLADAKEAQS